MTVTPIVPVRQTDETDQSVRTPRAQDAQTGGAGFEAALVGSAAARPIRPLVAHHAETVSPQEQFEAFALRNFVESMLPSDAEGFFGEGTAGSIWRSMLAEHLGAKLAEDGGIGIAAAIAPRVGSQDDQAERTVGATRNASLTQTLATLSLSSATKE